MIITLNNPKIKNALSFKHKPFDSTQRLNIGPNDDVFELQNKNNTKNISKVIDYFEDENDYSDEFVEDDIYNEDFPNDFHTDEAADSEYNGYLKKYKKNRNISPLKNDSTEKTVFDRYLGELNPNDFLDFEKEQEQLKIFMEGGPKSEIAREKLIKSRLPFVVHIAKKYQRRGLPIDDLIEEGNIGLIKGIDYTQNPQFKNINYNGYIAKYIGEAIKYAIERKKDLIKLPRNYADMVQKVNESISKLSSKYENKKIPTDKEIAADIKHSPETVRACKETPNCSLFTDILKNYDYDFDIENLMPDHRINEPEEKIIDNKLVEIIKTSLNNLSESGRNILIKRWGFNGGNGQTASEIAKTEGINKSSVNDRLMAAKKELLQNNGDDLMRHINIINNKENYDEFNIKFKYNLHRFLNKLPLAEKTVLTKVYGLNETEPQSFHKIASEFNLTPKEQYQIGKIKRNGLNLIQKHVGDEFDLGLDFKFQDKTIDEKIYKQIEEKINFILKPSDSINGIKDNVLENALSGLNNFQQNAFVLLFGLDGNEPIKKGEVSSKLKIDHRKTSALKTDLIDILSGPKGNKLRVYLDKKLKYTSELDNCSKDIFLINPNYIEYNLDKHKPEEQEISKLYYGIGCKRMNLALTARHLKKNPDSILASLSTATRRIRKTIKKAPDKVYLKEVLEDKNIDYSKITKSDKKFILEILKTEEGKDHLKRLTAKESEVLNLRFGIDSQSCKSGEAVAKMLNVTRQAVSLNEINAFKKLKRVLM